MALKDTGEEEEEEEEQEEEEEKEKEEDEDEGNEDGEKKMKKKSAVATAQLLIQNHQQNILPCHNPAMDYHDPDLDKFMVIKFLCIV